MNRREINTKRVEYSLTPVEDDFGVTHAEVSKTLQAVVNEYWQATGTAPGGPLPDDVVRFTVDPDTRDIVIFFELERRS